MSDTLTIRRIDTRASDGRQAIAELRERLSPRGNVVSDAGRRRTIEVFGEPLLPQQVVERILNDVRILGVKAVLDYSAKLDGKTLTADELRVPAGELEAAHRAADKNFLQTVRQVRDNVLRFQRAILHKDVRIETEHGGSLGLRYLPLARVGICVPGGAAAYPSTVLMTAAPAQAAGVKEIAIVAPPTKFGSYSPDLLATCHELGITEVYRMGGAQAVAALAYGVEGVKKVDKIVGPGNLFVALAKKAVYGEVDIDSIAGPSEVVVVADDTSRADFIASDMLAQAEHAPGSSVVISTDARLLDEVERELTKQLSTLERGDMARQSLNDFGALILTANIDEACQLASDIASEHLHIVAANPEQLLKKIPNAGAAFLGPFTPVAVGDYAAGPSHVLPTGGTARFSSGLSANDFLRRTSVLQFTEAGLTAIAPLVRTLADKEGLTAHKASVDVRVGKKEK